MAWALFQYQGYAAPPPVDPAPIVVPDLSWNPTYPDGYRRLPALTAAILAGAFFFTPAPNLGATTGSAVAGIAYADEQRQYMAQVAPFQAALTPPETQTLDRWGQPPSQPYPSLRRVPVSEFVQPLRIFATPEQLGWAFDGRYQPPTRFSGYQSLAEPLVYATPAVETHGSGVSGVGQLFGGRQLQYQSQVAPFVAGYAPTQTTEWYPSYPDQILRPVLRGFPAYHAVFDSVVPLGHVGWLPVYPERIVRPTVRAVDQIAFVAPRFVPIFDLRWAPSYPDFITRPSVRAADQQAIFVPRYLPISDLRWQGTYPDRISRLVVRAADQQALFEPRYLPITDLRWQGSFPDQVRGARRTAEYPAFVSGQTGSTIPITDLRWQGLQPGYLFRRLAQPWLYSTFSFYPFPLPNEPAPVLSWHPSYPNWINRRVFLAALQPFSDVRNLDPIPNEVVNGTTVITLGVEIGITDFPVLGGWVPF